MPDTVTFSLRLPKPMKDRLERLAEATERTQSYLCTQAIEEYLEAQAWQVETVQEALQKADSPRARFVSHDDVTARIRNLTTGKGKATR